MSKLLFENSDTPKEELKAIRVAASKIIKTVKTKLKWK